MDVEFCTIAEMFHDARDLLAFPDVDDNDVIVEKLMEILCVDRGISPTEFSCSADGYDIHMAEKNILGGIDKAKLSILRGMHSGDKVANILTSLVDVIRETGDAAIWKCPDCGHETSWDSDNAGDAGTPVCHICDIDMVPDRILLYDTQEWKDAEAYALRITQIRDSKKEKKDAEA